MWLDNKEAVSRFTRKRAGKMILAYVDPSVMSYVDGECHINGCVVFKWEKDQRADRGKDRTL